MAFNVDEPCPKGHLDISSTIFVIQPITSLIKAKGNLNSECVCFLKKRQLPPSRQVRIQKFVLNTKPLVGMKTVFLCS